MQIERSFVAADVFGLSPSARLALSRRPNPPGFDGLVVPNSASDVAIPPDPFDPDARAELSDALLKGVSALQPHVAVIESIRKLAEEGTSVVLAGQQPGFLGGPLYNLHKAAHAVRLARELSLAWGHPVVPAFWNHTDDHDLGEVHSLWIQNPDLDLRKVGMASASSTRRPLFDIRFDEELHRLGPVRELLRQNLWDGGPKEAALDLFVPRSGESFGQAFGRTMLELFGPSGLIVFEPHMIRSQLSRALAGALGTSWRAPLLERADAMRKAGLDVPIDPESAALVFRLKDGQKSALRFSNQTHELAFDDEPGSRTQAELAAEVLQAPDEFIAGALLRPVLQDAVLPTAAYIGGWGELAYHLELTGLRRATGVPTPAFVPRVSATLVTPESRHALERLEASVGEVLRAKGEFGANQQADPGPPVVGRLNAVAKQASEELLALKDDLASLDPGLMRQAKRTADQVTQQIQKLAQKATRVHSTQSGRGKRHLRRLNQGLTPRGGPQERVRGALEFVARFGHEWIPEWIDAIEPFPSEHVVLEFLLNPPPSSSP